ncbi:hypothetical protein MF672_033250 [Actinomadura sp. ATCC 31491]|uniref:Uncharacterized protein n=1 Tax=Actinomadura luzonensis TaxID=2805427 RepID=A0ABT0G2I8_9ACTN|nr:hypothetical protein [Actinomadura luzonensis]MCK2218628.1 hypothetical protein [Actinomadura luzonensis]
MLDAGPGRFAAALADVERRLDARIDDLVARRDTLRRLATGDRALLPEHVLAKLDRAAAELGCTDDDVRMAREGLVLVRALVPEGFDDYLAHPSLRPVPAGLRARADAALRYGLLARHGQERPAWARLRTLVEARMRAAGTALS